MHKIKDLEKQARPTRVLPEKTRRRPVPRTFATVTHGPIETAIAPETLGSKSSVDHVKFPLCDAAVRKMEGGEWDLADAILAECSETGEDGVRNGSHAKMEAMRAEIAQNHGVELSLERIRKLRKVASTFPPGRRRPAVSLEGHLEAGTPEALDALIKSAPDGTALTRAVIRQPKHPTEKAEQDAAEGRTPSPSRGPAHGFAKSCRQLERKTQLERERESASSVRELCRSIGKEPEPFSPPLAPEGEPSRTVAEDLEQSIRVLLMSHGFDPSGPRSRRLPTSWQQSWRRRNDRPLTNGNALAVPVPPGLTLLPHQQEGIRFALSRLRTNRGAMFGDVMGLGKTIEAIVTANAMGPSRILVVCPASVLFTWRREIWKWQTLGLPVFLVQAGRDTTLNHELMGWGVNGWYIVNYDILGDYPEIKSGKPWDLLIVR